MGPIAPAPSPPNQTQKQLESRKQGKTKNIKNQKPRNPKKKLLNFFCIIQASSSARATKKKRKQEQDYHRTLTALTKLILFVKMLKISK
jgi:hypothetical protein